MFGCVFSYMESISFPSSFHMIFLKILVAFVLLLLLHLSNIFHFCFHTYFYIDLHSLCLPLFCYHNNSTNLGYQHLFQYMYSCLIVNLPFYPHWFCFLMTHYNASCLQFFCVRYIKTSSTLSFKSSFIS